LDLTFERIVDVPPQLVWRAWTEPEFMTQWFCPLPWKTIDAEVDVRPGGIFLATVIHADEAGCQKHAALDFKKVLSQLWSLAERSCVADLVIKLRA
jgi:uncharacterized protein YndB with AHSA1/START domain